MTRNSKIDWCDTVWNPIVGCSKVSEGCRNCYAERFARRLAKNPKTKGKYKDVVKWDGTTVLDSFSVDVPIQWKSPRRIFINSMGDLFCSSVDPRWIDEILQIITVCPQHIFYALTKRPQNIEGKLFGVTEARPCRVLGGGDYLKNLWLGVSVEDQKTADERIPELLKIPGFKKFVSVEPMLGEINLDDLVKIISPGNEDHFSCLDCDVDIEDDTDFHGETISWIICGGETGPGARPCHPDWVRSLRNQCSAAGVPFFFKSWGNFIPFDQATPHQKESAKKSTARLAGDCRSECVGYWLKLNNKQSGYIIDGKKHREIPA